MPIPRPPVASVVNPSGYAPQDTLWDRTVGSAWRGALRDPIIAYATRGLFKDARWADPKILAGFESRLHDDPLANTFEVIGEYGPSLVAGMGVWGLGRRAATAALRTMAPHLAARGGRLAQQAARVLQYAEQGKPGAQVMLTGAPGLQRGAEIAGGSAAIGALTGAQEAATPGSDARSIAAAAALGAGLGAGTELAFMGAAKLMSPYTKLSTSVEKATEKWRSPEFQENVTKTELGLAANVRRHSQSLREILKSDEYADELAQWRGPRPGEVVPEGWKLPRQKPNREALLSDEGLDAVQKARASASALTAFRRTVREFEPIRSSYTRETPLNPRTFGINLQRLMAQVAKTPEAFSGQLGVTWAKVSAGFKAAEVETAMGEAINMTKVARWRRQAIKVLGRRGVNEKFMAEVKNYEVGGLGAVREELKPTFLEIEKELAGMAQVLDRAGAERMLNDQDFRRLGLQRFFPHTNALMNETQFEDQFLKGVHKLLVAEGRDPEAAKVEAQKLFADTIIRKRNGLIQFGSIDHQRAVRGSLADKIAAGMPVEMDPFISLATYLNAGVRRVRYGERFGYRGELAEPIKQLAEAEGADRALINSLVENFLGFKYVPQFQRQFARTAVNLQIGSKLTLAVIPNLSQLSNTVMFNGFRKTFSTAWKRLSEEERQHLETALGLHESMFQVMRRSMMGVQGEGMLDRFADATLKGTLFTTVERFNRAWSGMTGYFTVKDTLAKAMGGRLRGNHLEVSRRRFTQLGLDLDDIVKRGGRMTDDEKLRAMHRASQETQFNPDMTRRPIFWNHPVGRVLFQFKTFALGQGRFIRDQVLMEAARGNMKPMAHFLAIYPLAGELVGDALAIVKDRPREETGITRALDNVLVTGAGGVFQQLIIAARYGKALESLLGPTVSDLASLGEAVVRFSPDPLVRFVSRLPAVQAASFLTEGAAGLGAMGWEEYLEATSPVGGPEGQAVPLSELRIR